MEGKCKNCRFFKKVDQGGGIQGIGAGVGQCRRYPPKPFQVKTNLGSQGLSCYFPLTQEGWDCGEFQLAISLNN